MSAPRAGTIIIAYGAETLVINASDLDDPGFYYGTKEQTYYQIAYTDYGKAYVQTPILQKRNQFSISASLSMQDARKLYRIYQTDHDNKATYPGTESHVTLTISRDFPLLLVPPVSTPGAALTFNVKLGLSEDFLSKFLGSTYISNAVTNVDNLLPECLPDYNIPFVQVSFSAEEISSDSGFVKSVTLGSLTLDWQHWKKNGFSENTVAGNQPKINYSEYGVPYVNYPILSTNEKVYNFNVYLTESEVQTVKAMVESSKGFFVDGAGSGIQLTDNYWGTATTEVLLEIPEDFGINLIGLCSRDTSTELEYLYDCSFKAYSYGAEETAFSRTVTLSLDSYSVTLDYKNFTKSGFSVNPYASQQINPSYNPFGFSIIKNLSFLPKKYFTFNVILEESKVVEIRNMVNWSSYKFSTHQEGSVSVSDQFFGTGATDCALMIPDDFGSSAIGLRNQEILYSCTFKAVEL